MPRKHRHSGQVKYSTLLTTAIFGGDELPFGSVCLPLCSKWQAQMTNFGWPSRLEESQHQTTPAHCRTKLPLFVFGPFSPFLSSSEMKIWRQRDTILAAEFICLGYSACKCADGLRFAVCVVLCNGNQQFVDSSFKDQQEQTLLSFLSDFLQVNDWYWPYGITVAHCELCIKCNFPVHCGQVWLCCVQYPSSEGSQYCQRHS